MIRIHAASSRRGGLAARVLILGVVGVLLVLALIGWFAQPRRIQEDPARAITDAFLQQIQQGDLEAAWQATSAEFKSDMGREDFLQFVAKFPVLHEPLSFEAFRPIPEHPLPMVECVYLSAGSEGQTVRVLVALEREEWKVERLLVEPAVLPAEKAAQAVKK